MKPNSNPLAEVPPIIPRADLATASRGPAVLSDQPAVPPPQGPFKLEMPHRSRSLKNPELQAMQRISKILEEFDEPAQDRILGWVAAAYAKAKPIEAR